MKKGRFPWKVIYSSWFLAALPSALIMILIHPIGFRYKLDVKPVARYSLKYYYADLNSDSVSERIIIGKGTPYYFISVKNQDDQIYDQWNLKDTVNTRLSEVFFGNFNHDKFKEIYVFTHSGDSLFLNVNEMLQPSGIRINRLFITRIGYLKGELAAVIMPAGFYDENNDGWDELYFSISSAYTLGPRKLYCLDLINRSLKSTPSFGSICLDPRIIDADNDKRPEIFGTMSASGNYRSDVPYSDSSTWLMVFDDRLNFKFPPVEFKGFANALFTFPYQNGQFHGYVLSHQTNGTDTSVLKAGVMIFNSEGKLRKYRRYDDFIRSWNSKLFVVRSESSDRIYVLADQFFELNDSLMVIRKVDINVNSSLFSYQADINGDGIDEFLLYSEDEKKLLVYNINLHKLTEEPFQTPDTGWKLYPFLSKEHKYMMFISSANNGTFIKLKRNDLFILGYFAYPGIYLAIFLFIEIIKRISAHQLKTREALNNRLVAMQLQGIKAQLDPHFTFNTLNSIASLIYLEDRQAAYDYMRKFTQMLRSMLNDAEKIYRSLGEELDFLTTYLDLEKLRFGKKFDYSIEIGEGISQREMVPKLVLQTFAENAVKHGIMPSEKGGIIRIVASREQEYLKLVIEDNGVGRQYSSGHSNSTGKGLKLTSEFYDILNSINKKPLRYLITDLYDSSRNPSGTRVEVWVPSDVFTDQTRK